MKTDVVIEDVLQGVELVRPFVPLLAAMSPLAGKAAELVLPLVYEAAVRLRDGVVTTEEIRDAERKQLLEFVDQVAAARFG